MMATAWMLMLLAFASGPNPRTISQWRVDLIEVNTIYNRQAQPVFVQVIAWRRFADDRDRYHTVGWRAMRGPEEWPSKHGGQWHFVTCDSRRRVHVTSPHLRISHTQTDPERDDNLQWWHGRPHLNIFDTMAQPLPGIESTDAP